MSEQNVTGSFTGKQAVTVISMSLDQGVSSSEEKEFVAMLNDG